MKYVLFKAKSHNRNIYRLETGVLTLIILNSYLRWTICQTYWPTEKKGIRYFARRGLSKHGKNSKYHKGNAEYDLI